MNTHTQKHTARKGRLRAHVIVPADLIQEIDALVGPRGRSDFFVEAAREKIARERLREAAHAVAGSLRDVEIPGWGTPEETSEWVRRLRQESDEKAYPAEEA